MRNPFYPSFWCLADLAELLHPQQRSPGWSSIHRGIHGDDLTIIGRVLSDQTYGDKSDDGWLIIGCVVTQYIWGCHNPVPLLQLRQFVTCCNVCQNEFPQAFPLGIVLNYSLGLVCSRPTQLWPDPLWSFELQACFVLSLDCKAKPDQATGKVVCPRATRISLHDCATCSHLLDSLDICLELCHKCVFACHQCKTNCSTCEAIEQRLCHEDARGSGPGCCRNQPLPVWNGDMFGHQDGNNHGPSFIIGSEPPRFRSLPSSMAKSVHHVFLDHSETIVVHSEKPCKQPAFTWW